jgi:membrane protein DedA with SNARE-associated domain
MIFLVVFLNNLGFPLPGDSMLLGGGFLAGKGVLAEWAVVACGTMGCFLGGTGAYWLGLRYGRRFLTREIRWLRITPERVAAVERFFGKYGAKTVFFARLVALLHPVTGLLAGLGKTPFGPFLLFNFLGALTYSALYVLAGRFFGQRWDQLKSWAGPTALYGLLGGAAILVLLFFLRSPIRDFFTRLRRPASGGGSRRMKHGKAPIKLIGEKTKIK